MAKPRKDPDTLPDGPARCSLDDRGSVTPCRALSAVVDRNNRKGVVVWSFVNIQTMKHTRNLYGCKSGKFGGEGLVFSFCPFCGTGLSAAEAGLAALPRKEGE